MMVVYMSMVGVTLDEMFVTEIIVRSKQIMSLVQLEFICFHG